MSQSKQEKRHIAEEMDADLNRGASYLKAYCYRLIRKIKQFSKKGGGRDMKILVVEDMSFTRATYVRYLNNLGYKDIVEASEGGEGLKRFKDGGIQLVLTDIQMEPMDGITLVKEIRKLDSEIPIIVLTGETGQDTVREMTEAGADEYLVKPFNIKTLREKIASASAE